MTPGPPTGNENGAAHSDSNSRIVILNEVKNLLVGVRVGAADSAILSLVLRRMILRYAQNDTSRLTPGSGRWRTGRGSSLIPTLFSEEMGAIVGAGPRACPLSLPLYGWYTNWAGTRVPSGQCPYELCSTLLLNAYLRTFCRTFIGDINANRILQAGALRTLTGDNKYLHCCTQVARNMMM
jgi:hypothetical protein